MFRKFQLKKQSLKDYQQDKNRKRNEIMTIGGNIFTNSLNTPTYSKWSSNVSKVSKISEKSSKIGEQIILNKTVK